MGGVEIVINFEVDLFAVGIVDGSVRQTEFGAVVSAARPLINRGV